MVKAAILFAGALIAITVFMIGTLMAFWALLPYLLVGVVVLLIVYLLSDKEDDMPDQ